jgi:hypothetical protein
MRRSASACTSGLRVPAECVRTSWSERTRAGIQGQQAPAVFVAPGSRIFPRVKPGVVRDTQVLYGRVKGLMSQRG